MPSTLIILAHPERNSFNGAWADATAAASLSAGHDVIWSDLYGMGFDAAESRKHYPEFAQDRPFDPLKAQEEAAESLQLPADVVGEIAKIRKADRIICHFPLWWFGAPAILKGWLDRVLVHGELHTIDQRFDRGLCTGKTVLFCVTLGATEVESSFNGKEGDVALQLWPLAYTMRYLGMTVLEPVVANGVHGYFEGAEADELRQRLTSVLDRQSDIINEFDNHAQIRFNADKEFDDDGRLKPDAASYSPMIRHQT